MPLLAANGSSIKTYGTRTLSLHFAFDTYKWDFVITDVSRPLLGADFLRSNSLLVDLKGRRLVDATTYHSVPLSPTRGSAPHLDASTNQYDLLLAEFPDITTPNFIHLPVKHGIEHFIITKGPPVHARVRRLPPDKLLSAKSGWNSWVLYVVHPAPGHHHYTWCRKLLEGGALVETTGTSTMPQYLTGTRYPTYRIFPLTSLA